ncbi:MULTISPECIES: tyrosine recombinase XerC [unclassified Streptomyces]|uniref:site-specific integrase n=1 Tax=unclassified Streptomyces TaxID=2593676 RepID=UPI00364B94D9
MPEAKKLPPDSKGRTRYRAVVDIGRDPTTGKRKQVTITKSTAKDVKAEVARLTHERDTGALIMRRKITVSEWTTEWFARKAEDIEENTKHNYTMQLDHIRRHLGAIQLQDLTEADVEAFRQTLLTTARRHGATAGTGLHPRSVEEILSRLRVILQRALIRKLVHANVAQYVAVTKRAKAAGRKQYPRPEPWTVPEVHQFVAGLEGDRLYAPLLLSLMGLRPAEVCGLRWSEDVDLQAGTLAIANTRTMVANNARRVIEKDTKTEAGSRVLPLPKRAADALSNLRVTQAKERLGAGEAYTESGYVFVDELGVAYTTRHLREFAYKIMNRLGLRRVRLYDARHSCMTFLNSQGVADHVLAAWAGHASADFTRRRYVHVSPEDLQPAADAWDGLHGHVTKSEI